jgi:nucleotide-binding universal stress UspA family protein
MAASWTRALRVPLEVVTVIDPTRTPPPDGGATAHRSWAEVEADHVARIADGAGVEASWSVLAGDPADAVAGYAQGHASLLALATHGRSGIGRAVAGSVALRIVRRAPCPVLIVRPRELG